MQKPTFRVTIVALFALVSLSLSLPFSVVRGQNGSIVKTSAEKKLGYPITKKVDVVDDYFGTKVVDPYRWLENNDSPEVAAWVEAQNKVSFDYLARIPYRKAVYDRLTKLYNYPKIGAPQRRGEWFVFTKNDGLQNQSIY
jgi:prolyl oligopeptidase